jgi:electron-transferring-flavoprotein dehydrogenase
MEKQYDVIIIGAGTAGIFFARKMAEQGYKIAVFDKLPEDRQGERLGVFHTDQEHFTPYGVPQPELGDEDYVSKFETGVTKSAFNHYPKITEYPFLVLRFKPFLKRLRSWALQKDVSFFFEYTFQDFIYKNNKPVGAVFTDHNDKTEKFSARLVADCSGIPSVARRRLKSNIVENFEIMPRDMFYVLLHYVRFKNPADKDKISFPTGYAQYKSWFGETEDPAGFLFGTGANLSYDFTMKCHDRFREIIPAPEYEEYKDDESFFYQPKNGTGKNLGREGYWEQGVTPYHREPYSLIDDGFVCMGDSACMTKPFSGEGISCAWKGCDMAARVAGKAMQNGAYPTAESLWDYNLQYFTTQGADFANMRATLVNAVDCTAEENEYEFKKDIIFSSKQFTRTNRNFNSDLPIGDVLALIPKILFGIISGNITIPSVKNLTRGILTGSSLKSHYKKYPKTPAGYKRWSEKAEKLWEKAGNMADVVERSERRVKGK